MTTEESNVIKNLRLPLMIMVVFIHSILIERTGMEQTIWIENLFSKCIPIVAVPLFMFFSGFLFFANVDKPDTSFYARQLTKRVKSLLVPYLLWNSLIILFFYLMHKFAPTLINENFNNIANFSAAQLIDCFWRGSGGFPIAYQFWFIRDLIIINLFAPLIYVLVKFGRIMMLILLILSYTVSHIDMMFYYTLGAFCALQKIDFVRYASKIRPFVVVIATISLIAMASGLNDGPIKKTYILSGAMSILSLPFLRGGKFTALLNRYSSASFFLFAIHGIIALLLCKLIAGSIHSNNQIVWIALYFANVIFIVFFCICLYKILRKLLPKPLAILTGGR